MKTALIFAISFAVIFYAFVAIIAAELNPMLWPVEVRGYTLLAYVLAMWLAVEIDIKSAVRMTAIYLKRKEDLAREVQEMAMNKMVYARWEPSGAVDPVENVIYLVKSLPHKKIVFAKYIGDQFYYKTANGTEEVLAEPTEVLILPMSKGEKID